MKTSTAYLYKKNVELYIVPHLGNIKLEALNTHTVQHFYNQLVSPTNPAVNPLSGKTVKNIHGVFHKAMQQAVLIGYLRVNPMPVHFPVLSKKKCTRWRRIRFLHF